MSTETVTQAAITGELTPAERLVIGTKLGARALWNTTKATGRGLRTAAQKTWEHRSGVTATAAALGGVAAAGALYGLSRQANIADTVHMMLGPKLGLKHVTGEATDPNFTATASVGGLSAALSMVSMGLHLGFRNAQELAQQFLPSSNHPGRFPFSAPRDDGWTLNTVADNNAKALTHTVRAQAFNRLYWKNEFDRLGGVPRSTSTIYASSSYDATPLPVALGDGVYTSQGYTSPAETTLDLDRADASIHKGFEALLREPTGEQQRVPALV